MDLSLSGGVRSTQKSSPEAPILAYPDYSKPFILETDASLKGLGAVLSQKGDDNEIADALSRRPEVEEETEKEIPPESDDDEWIAVSYQVEEQGGRISSMEFNQVISELVGGPKLTKNLKIAYRLRMSQRKS